MLSRSKKVLLRTEKQYFQQARSVRTPFGVLYLLNSNTTKLSVIVQKQRFSKATKRNEIKRQTYAEVVRVWDLLILLRSQIVLVVQSPQHLTGKQILEAATRLYLKHSSKELI